MKTIRQTVWPLAALLVLAACGNLSRVTAEGSTEQPVWPEINKAGVNYSGSQHGTWPNWDNVRQIEAGMNKAQLYRLIGEPHFSEGFFRVREWDYVFNYRQNGEHKICQFKVLFDKNMNAQTFLWQPAGCNQQYELAADLLFDFDAAVLSADGRSELDRVIRRLNAQNVQTVSVAGYADRLGAAAYNQQLSQQRADAVKNYFVRRGFAADAVRAVGYGQQDQVAECAAEQGEALKQCLRPNRRVVISGG